MSDFGLLPIIHVVSADSPYFSTTPWYVGAFFSAIPSLGLNGWVFGLSLVPGAYLGVQILKRIP